MALPSRVKTFSTLLLFTSLILALSAAIAITPVSGQASQVIGVNIEGTITASTAELVGEAIKRGEESNSPVILLLNTPGGALDATFSIISSIEASSVPVISYVSPQGATAWSAGTFILLSSHIAAMAPSTVIGSAQPVAISPTGGAQPIEDEKTLNALVAYLTERAKDHHRNETAARLFITENLNLNADNALSQDVVEFTAPTLEQLLTSIDGLKIITSTGEFQLKTSGAEVIYQTPSLKITILGVLSDPIIASVLLSLGIFSLVFGFSLPGHGGEVIGAVLLILGLIGLGQAGANLGATLLIGLGGILLIAELFTHGFGILGGAGFFSIIFGGLLLFPSPMIVSQDYLNLLLISLIVIPLAFGGFFIFAAYKILQARRAKPRIKVGMIGETVVVVEEVNPNRVGYVLYQGERWRARSEIAIPKGGRALVIAKEGPILVLRPQ